MSASFASISASSSAADGWESPSLFAVSEPPEPTPTQPPLPPPQQMPQSNGGHPRGPTPISHSAPPEGQPEVTTIENKDNPPSSSSSAALDSPAATVPASTSAPVLSTASVESSFDVSTNGDSVPMFAPNSFFNSFSAPAVGVDFSLGLQVS